MTENREPYHLSGKPRPTTRIAPTNYAETAGNVVAVVVVAAAWACGAFWALQSGALDLQKRAVGNA
ncbi:hypothetical protein JCM12107_15260 [Corynebacterium simulans]